MTNNENKKIICGIANKNIQGQQSLYSLSNRYSNIAQGLFIRILGPGLYETRIRMLDSSKKLMKGKSINA